MIILWICLIALGGLLYRLGGTSAGTLWRDLGVSALITAIMAWLNWIPSLPIIIGLFLSWGLCYGALTTYWKRRGTDAKWWNWLLHGLGIALAMLPYALVSRHFLGFGIRLVVLPVATMLWSEWIGQDWLEEGGRGALIIATLPLLLI